MKTIEFQDIDGNKIRLQHSSLASQTAFRIYLEGEQFIEKVHAGEKIPICLHLNHAQTRMLINGMLDLINDTEI